MNTPASFLRLALLTVGLLACSESSDGDVTSPPPSTITGGAGGSSTTSSTGGSATGGNALGGGGSSTAGGSGGGWPTGFTPTQPNLPPGYLCDIPPDYVQNGGDPVNPPCQLESDQLSDRNRFDVPLSLKIVTWNVEWGKDSVGVSTALLTEPALIDADILLLQEVPRNDKEGYPPNINLARQLAQQLKMNYVFGVEWDRRLDNDQEGEHGLATLSKYPIGNALLIRHTPLSDFYQEKSHYGGRATLALDLVIGDERVRVYNAHLATRDFTGQGRAVQGDEILADAHLAGQPTVQLLGGDLNTFLCNPLLATCNDPAAAEPVIVNVLNDGWTDLLPTFNSWTQLGLDFFGQRLDWLFAKQVTPALWDVLQDVDPADHRPVIATFGLFDR